jgi:hypothetical protein
VVLDEQAKNVRASILALAQKHMTDTSSVAEALISFSLAQVRKGTLAIEARPNAKGRKMALRWEEGDGRAQTIPAPGKPSTKERTKNLYLNYRWGREVDAEIKALAGEAIPAGETVVFLLHCALEAHKRGRLILKEEPRVVTQKVRLT